MSGREGRKGRRRKDGGRREGGDDSYREYIADHEGKLVHQERKFLGKLNVVFIVYLLFLHIHPGVLVGLLCVSVCVCVCVCVWVWVWVVGEKRIQGCQPLVLLTVSFLD